jgi:CHAT domain-containing protein
MKFSELFDQASHDEGEFNFSYSIKIIKDKNILKKVKDRNWRIDKFKSYQSEFNDTNEICFDVLEKYGESHFYHGILLYESVQLRILATLQDESKGALDKFTPALQSYGVNFVLAECILSLEKSLDILIKYKNHELIIDVAYLLIVCHKSATVNQDQIIKLSIMIIRKINILEANHYKFLLFIYEALLNSLIQKKHSKGRKQIVKKFQDIIEKEYDQFYISKNYLHISIYYSFLNDDFFAQNSINKSLLNIEKINNLPKLSYIYNMIGICFKNLGLYLSSIEYFNKSLNIRLKIYGNASRLTGDVYHNIARVYEVINDTYNSYKYYELSGTPKEMISNRNRLSTLSNSNLLFTDDPEIWLSFFREEFENMIIEKNYDIDSFIQKYESKFTLFNNREMKDIFIMLLTIYQLNKFNSKRVKEDKFTNIIESLYNECVIEITETKNSFLTEKLFIFDKVSKIEFSYYLFKNDLNKAIKALEKSKIIFSKFQYQYNKQINKKSYNLKKEDLIKYTQEIFNEETKTINEFSNEKLNELLESISISNVQENLQNDDAVIYFVINKLSPISYVLILLKGKVEVIELHNILYFKLNNYITLMKELILSENDLIEEMKVKYLDNDLDLIALSKSDLIEKLNTLIYNDLFQTIINYLKKQSIKSIFIAYDYSLDLIPVELIKDEDNEYLIQRYNICYINSLDDFRNKKKDLEIEGLLGFGCSKYNKVYFKKSNNFDLRNLIDDDINLNNIKWSNLPGVEDELRIIEEIIEKKEMATSSKIFYNENCTIHNFQNIFSSNLNNSKIVHIAVHGYYNNEIPELNSLVFYNDNSDPTALNKYLTVDDISKLNLNQSIVFLSACSTMSGRSFGSLGIQNIGLAFKNAGAKFVITTLWEINDKLTVKFINYFYEEFFKCNNNLIEALTNTKRNCLNDKELSLPKNWGAFIVF